MKLSPTQQDALTKCRENGFLVRWPGGFWTTAHKPPGWTKGPQWYVGTNTVRSLVEKGLLVEKGYTIVVPAEQNQEGVNEK